MKVELENVLPREIEARSFEIITQELGDTPLIPGTELIVKRCIHTSADFDYAKNLRFSEGVVEKALKAIQNGASIVTDTQMARAGINKKALARYGGEVYCFMSDEDVARKAKEHGTICQCGSIQRADYGNGDTLYCSSRQKRRKQHCGLYLQCAAVYAEQQQRVRNQ